jgi:hypothetical protein
LEREIKSLFYLPTGVDELTLGINPSTEVVVRFAVLFYLLAMVSSASYADKLYTNLTFDNVGKIGLGVDYEAQSTSTIGYGAYSRILFDDDDEESGERQNGVLALGGFMRAHFTQDTIDFFISPGFGMAQIDLGEDDETVLGPAFMTGFNVKMSTFSLGFNITQLYGWFGDIHGLVEQPLFMLSFVLPM